MARGIKQFSQRDRVAFQFIPEGQEFLYRGARWQRQAKACVGGHSGSAAIPLLPARRRVTVTRKSGLARLAEKAAFAIDRGDSREST